MVEVNNQDLVAYSPGDESSHNLDLIFQPFQLFRSNVQFCRCCLVLNLNRLGYESDRLEYHLEASRGQNAITTCVRVEGVPL